MKNQHFPFPIGTVHIIGIGGIGMSGYAEVLHNLGYKVQGSDQSENANVLRLRALGLTHVEVLRRCTVEDSRLFSYRRDGVTGRMGAAICLQAGA